MRVVSACLSLLVLTMAGAASAQSAGPEFSFNAAVASDYVFRGVSQTDEEPAIQAGADVSFGAFYAGVWASNVDFGDGTDAEFDLYGGVLVSAGGFDLDFGVIGYHYIGAPDAADYDLVEFKASASRGFDAFTAGAAVYYSPDFGSAGDATYLEANLEYAATERLTLSGVVGRQWLEYGTDYNSWNLGAAYALTEALSVDVRYHDSGIDGPLSDGRVVLGLGVAF